MSEAVPAEALTIPAFFNGPIDSGNGGYASGVFAGLIDGPAEVSLKSPVPLGRPLDAAPTGDGSIHVLDGDVLVAEVQAVDSAGAGPGLPPAVNAEEARRASESYSIADDGVFSRCFVCGPAREDSFGVFAGVVEGRDVVASPWTPPGWTAGEDGKVRPEFVWAVLDCPTYVALYPDSMPMSFLVRMSARIDVPVEAGSEHVVMAWPVERDGRKHHAASAVMSAEGEPLATARALLINTGKG